MIRAGKMRQRVKVQRRPVPRPLDDSGQARDVWETVAERWAEVTPLQGAESVLAGQVSAGATHLVVMRYCEGLSPEWRLEYRGRVLEIVSVLDVGERRARHEASCKEKK